MKILVVSTPATGHLNPLLAIGRILMAEGHELVFLTGSGLRGRIEPTGAKFHLLPKEADLDHRKTLTADEIRTIPPGPQLLRVAVERFFVDTIPGQHSGIQQVLREV